MPKKPIKIVLTKEEYDLLKENTKPSIQYRFAQRAKVVILAAEGRSNNEIAKLVDLSFVAVSKWRHRYATHGIVGLKDKPGRGRKKRLTHDQILNIVETACKKPENRTHWSLRELAKELGFVKKSRLQQVLKSLDLKPHQFKMWCFSTDPAYEEKKMDVVGLYLNPPKNALVVCIDEKTGIQALSRKIKTMEQGKVERRDHIYERCGTVDLFAAFRVHDGKIMGKIEAQHGGIEFLKFVQLVYRRWGGKDQLHIILDNLSTHEVKSVKKWLGKRKNVQFHFTPTNASWLNQIELWFSVLERQVIRRGSFESKEKLGETIMRFISEYNKHSKPFAWCYGDPLKM